MEKDLSAFPVPPSIVQGVDESHAEPGISLRDYFAAQAMQADMHPGLYHMITHGAENKYDAIAAVAYFQADAMLRARNG